MEQNLTFIKCLDLIKRMPPSNVSNNIDALCSLVPELEDQLVSNIDQQLRLQNDTVANKQFLVAEYNRDGDSHRSPWSNLYFDDEGQASDPGNIFPSKDLRDMEIKANEMFEQYKELYYSNEAVQSTYILDKEGGGFTFCQMNKKVQSQTHWDSINMVVVDINSTSIKYHLTSSFIIDVEKKEDQQIGDASLSGCFKRQLEELVQFDTKNDSALSHLVKIGTLIEKNESSMRGQIENISTGKIHQIIENIKAFEKQTSHQSDFQKELLAKIQK